MPSYLLNVNNKHLLGSPERLTRSACDVLSTLWTERGRQGERQGEKERQGERQGERETGERERQGERETGRERQREYQEMVNGMDDHNGEGTKQEEVTDFGHMGNISIIANGRFGGPGVSWGFCCFLLALLKAKG